MLIANDANDPNFTNLFAEFVIFVPSYTDRSTLRIRRSPSSTYAFGSP